MRFPWFRGLAIGAPAATGAYVAGGYSSGNIGYAPVRSKDWVDYQMKNTQSIIKLQQNNQFQQLEHAPKISQLHGEDGAVNEVTMSFRDKTDPQHTITYVHCGPLTIGFPFLVHGGVLGTLLRQSAQLALNKDNGDLVIKYKKPTIVDSIIKIETQRTSQGLELFITSADSDKVLVEASYSPRGWFS